MENSYQAVLEHAGEAVIFIEAESGRIVHANRWAEKLTGLGDGDLIPASSSESPSLGWLQDVIQEAKHRKTVRSCAIWESPEFSRSKNRLLDIFVTHLHDGDSSIAVLMRTVNTDRAIEKKLWRRNHELHLLNHASRTVSRSLDPREVAGLALDLSLDLLNAKAGIAYLSDFERQSLIPVVCRGLPETIELGELGFYGSQNAVTAFKAAEPLFHTTGGEKFLGGESRFTATIPLQTNEAVLGVLEIAMEDKGLPGVDCDIALLSSFGYQVGVALDNALLHRRVEDASRTDSLTGIYIRGHLESQLDELIKRANRYGEAFAVLMIDIDRFKAINDLHGHDVGDRVIRKVVDALRAEVRESDFLGRWGGEEFLIVLSNVGCEEAYKTAERIRLRIAALNFEKESGNDLPVTVCAGIACFPDHSLSRDGLVRCSDDAMRFAKRAGRNRTQLFGEEMSNLPPAGRTDVIWTDGMETIRALAAALDAKDSYTASHSESVRVLAAKLARCMNIDEQRLEILERASLLHDIGKVAIPDSILNKPGSPDPEEWDIIKEHPRLGVLILKEAPQLSTIIPVVLHHHENFDGTGYPQGLAREKIPPLSRILRVADAFMAMVSTRPYRRAMLPMEAWHTIEQESGRLFDPAVVEALAKTVARETGILADLA